MLNHIVTLLYQKGYHPFDEKEGGILVRETEQIVYVVTLSTFRSSVKADNYEQVKRRIEFMAASRYQKTVQTLHLVAVRNGMFEDEMLQLAEQLANVWLIAEDTGRIYIFENQPEQFDNLYSYLEQGIPVGKKSRQSQLSFTLTPVNLSLIHI